MKRTIWERLVSCMNRLARAELYRLRHVGRIWGYTRLAVAVIIFMMFSNAQGWMNQPLAEYISADSDFMGVLFIMFSMLIPFLVALVPSTLYGKGKPGYYEVMAGAPIHSRIWSKLLTDGLIYTILAVFSLCAVLVVIAVKNGFGGYNHVWARFGLFVLAVAHVVIMSVMIALCFRTMLAAGVAYIRFLLVDNAMFSSIAWFGAEKLGWSENLVENVHMLSVNTQIERVCLGSVNTNLMLHVILGFLVEFALWYLFCYIGMKKRLYQ